MSQLMRLWYFSQRRQAKAQALPAHPRSLARAIAVRTHEVWKKTKGLTKNQTSSPTGWLCMRVWRMSLRRTKSAIISWDGSNMNLSMSKPTNDLCTHWRLRSAWASVHSDWAFAQSDQSCPSEEGMGSYSLATHKAHSETLIRLGARVILLLFSCSGSYMSREYYRVKWLLTDMWSVTTLP